MRPFFQLRRLADERASMRVWVTFGLVIVLIILGWASLHFLNSLGQPMVVGYDGKQLATGLTDPHAQQRSYELVLFTLGLICLGLVLRGKGSPTHVRADSFLDAGYPGPS